MIVGAERNSFPSSICQTGVLLFLEAGLRAVPNSIFIRFQYLESLVPWWGGSLTEIFFFLERIDNDSPHDQKMKPLGGFYDYIYGKMLGRKGERKEAVKYFDKALSYGEYSSYRIGKGRIPRIETALARFL